MNEPYLAASPGVAPPSQDDAAVIERSWDEPERFGAGPPYPHTSATCCCWWRSQG
ncbi:hypothetical protein ACQPZZ_26870 [Microbispora sp. CA-135349]|uniref:hypothetical protein n=1 Tax=Microbispora sp. CA-135349 TaxID=3239953 RepID=UPI003D90C3B6